jgi:Ca2+-binding RTX toxin-like protein
MQDRSQSADRQESNAGAARTPAADAPEQRAQVAALDGAPAAADFGSAAGAVGLDDDMLSAELAQLMQVPVLPEPVSGERAVIPFSAIAAVGGGGGDPQMLLSMLTSLSLSKLMSLSVSSGMGLLQELDAIQAGDGMPGATDPFAAEFLHNMLSLPLPDLMSVGPLQDLFLTTYADHPGHFDFVWNRESPKAAGALPSGAPSRSDHHPEQPAVGVGTFPVPPPPPALFTVGSDTVVFDTLTAGQFAAGNWYDAIGGDDHVVLPSSASVAAALGYDPAQVFSGGADNDTIVAGGLADAIDGGSGIDTVSYANSSAVVILLQDTDTHGPHANEPAGGSGGFAAGDTYASIEMLVASPFDDYVFGGAAGGSVDLSGGNDVFDNTETQVVSDSVDGGAGNDTMWGGDGVDTLLGGGGGDALNGERGADRLDGGGGADTLGGGDGDDLLDGGTGSDRLSGGNGNDTLIWRDADALLAGDAGTDTLRIAAGDIDLASLAGIASGIERIDLATDAAANNVTLTATDVLSLSDTDVLALTGTAADAVDAGTGWTDAGFDGFGNHAFTKLVGPSLATLVVNQDVTVNADITT